ncbi:MAG TPA: hypothetical protein PLS25_05675 [Methanoregulaceae archaeon]|nr:hypothetical protein [Methanoregulaceae archaeon]
MGTQNDANHEPRVIYTGGDSGSMGLMGLAQMLLGADSGAIGNNYQGCWDGGIALLVQVLVSQELNDIPNRWQQLLLEAFRFHLTGKWGTFKRTTDDGTAMMMGDIDRSGSTGDRGTLVVKHETITWLDSYDSVVKKRHMDNNHKALHEDSIQGSRVFIKDNPQQSLERYSSAPFPRVPTEWLGSCSEWEGTCLTS